MHLPNWFLKLSNTKRVLAVLALAALAYFALNQILTRFPIREHKMNEFTQHTQTVCVGRFLIDLPAQATIVQRRQKINDVEIERVEKPSPTFQFFEQEAREYEAKLRRMPHPKKQTLFKETLRFTPDSFTFVYLEDEHTSDLYKVETWLWREKTQLRLIGSTTTNYFKDGIEETRATVTALQLRDNTAIPTASGACGDGTFFTGKDFRMEDFGISVRLIGYPGVWMGFGTETHFQPYEEMSLTQRITRSLGMPDVAGLGVDTRRNVSVMVNGQKGDEYVARIVEKADRGDKVTLGAKMEIYPTPNRVDQPLITMSSDNDSHNTGDGTPYPRVMEDDLFLSIWDKALKSIRLRPGAI